MTNRIKYIDAMRGLAMTLVVIGHVCLFSFNTDDNIVQRILCGELELPLFFFVSGFLIHVPEYGLGAFLKGKAFALCVPAAIFMLAYAWVNGYCAKEVCFDLYKYGYWFTYTLFGFIILHVGLKVIAKLLRLSYLTESLFLIVASIVILYTSVLCLRYESQYSVISLLGLPHFRFFIYFALGTIIANYKKFNDEPTPRMEVWTGGIVVICLLLHLYSYKDAGFSYIGSSTLWAAATTTSGVLVLLLGFKKYSSWSDSKWGGQFLQVIGRRTLDVYFIHYFFLPRNLYMVGKWFQANPNPFVEFIFAIMIAIPIIAISLLIGQIIRLNPIVAHWLLATKIKK